ncbi:MAG: hypothetical protein GC203_19175 [Phenylobacterium sp.]|nr:hypothetical protein [Phenylobacterium sp.]
MLTLALHVALAAALSF